MMAVAHQPYESSALARLEGEGIELTVTASLEIAKLLVEKSAESGSPHEQLMKVGAGLYEVTGNGEPLRPERVFYNQREGEAVFSAIYPQARPGDLQFRAVYLDKLPPGYGGSIRVVEGAERILGFQQRLRRGDAANSITVHIKPVAGQPVVVTPAPSARAPSVPVADIPPRLDPKPWRPISLIVTVAAAWIAAWAAWLVARNKPKEKTHV